ncbi:MAG TPA: ribosome biogenesis GTP-binding protein YihA/YsxC [Burkholderiales bacterium]|nr:ribosome biogenesis GTP-binding protein YihA/YsxC [Burkholderiales bacterium]
MNPFSQATFLASSGSAADRPPPGPPEIAFAGRSNVGKSSAINALLGRKRLAFTSKTPGRTQTLNFFALGDTARLVDLPGYGFARVPKAVRAQWQTLVGDYIAARDTLVGVVVIMDARHPLTPLDAQLIAFLAERPLLVLLSKADKLTRPQQAATLKEMQSALAGEVMLFSSVTRQGVDECRCLLERWLEMPAPQAAGIKNPR